MACTPGGSTTPNLTLCKPASGETNWAAVVNANMDTIDALFNGSTALLTTHGGTGLTAAGANGNVLTSNGTNWVSQSPSGAVLGAHFGSITAQVGVNGTSWNTMFNVVAQGDQLVNESTYKLPVPSSITLTKMTVFTNTSQPVGGSLVFTLRKNSVSTNVTVIVAAGSAAGTFTGSGLASYVQGDFLSVAMQNNDLGVGSARIIGWLVA